MEMSSNIGFDLNEFVQNYDSMCEFLNGCDINDVEKMVSIISGNNKISLRLLDWFVTSKYSEIITNDYMTQVNLFGKDNFVAFNMGYDRFDYHYDKNNRNKKINTSLAQLNFFKWAMNNGTLNNIEQNLDQIKAAMIKHFNK